MRATPKSSLSGCPTRSQTPPSGQHAWIRKSYSHYPAPPATNRGRSAGSGIADSPGRQSRGTPADLLVGQLPPGLPHRLVPLSMQPFGEASAKRSASDFIRISEYRRARFEAGGCGSCMDRNGKSADPSRGSMKRKAQMARSRLLILAGQEWEPGQKKTNPRTPSVPLPARPRPQTPCESQFSAGVLSASRARRMEASRALSPRRVVKDSR